ncbi:MAG: hypothetical protein K0R62_2718 [Nonomuraea muscovyensis]|jgi:predicted DNA-binding transcriptional regulator AlpA|nr:hypothetical protein [Nonomuraea muscovyensis]
MYMDVQNGEAERWLPVVGWEGLYEVSSQGRVRSLYSGTRSKTGFPKPHCTSRGQYMAVDLSRQGKRKTIAVHVLVAAAFIGPRPDGMDVCHNDGDSLNNRPENLRYGTRSENVLDEIAHGTHRHASRTHCAAGHELTEDNVYRCKARPKSRQCRKCRAARRKWTSPDYSEADGMATTREAGELLDITWKSVYVFMTQAPDFPQPKRIRNRLFWDRAALAEWRARHPSAQ